MSQRFLASVFLFTACFMAPVDHMLGTSDAGRPGERCLTPRGYEQYGPVCVTLHPTACNGQTCGAGEICCQTTGACVSESASCPIKPTTWGSTEARACGSVADCEEGEYCMLDQRGVEHACVGSGHCEPLTNCAYCSLPGNERCQVCGCDGVTYESPQAACVAGVSVPADLPGACGKSLGLDGGAFTIQCRSSAQCPSSADCCPVTGRCFERTEPWRCERRADGRVFNCLHDSDCVPYGPGSGGGGGTNDRYCQTTGCGETPGVCDQPFSATNCSGVVNNVCGCDGRTYVNECWARAAGTNIASNGACP